MDVAPAWGQEQIDFSSQVRPILSDRCFHCHGPDATNQDSDFRLDTEANIFADLGGYAGVVPGDLKSSLLHERIHSADESELMPPPDSNRSLTEAEKRILDLWIEQGAPYEGHWAFDPPTRPNVPSEALKKSTWKTSMIDRWSNEPIDAFVARRLITEGLVASPPADPATRLRRASLTLTGLLPSRELQERYLSDPTEARFVESVDELMNSMAYAERQTLRWLDAARYADTDGYQNDNHRTNWPWRDWLIGAFHDNMPFNQFTIEQLAGDMLANASLSQQLATSFNRNHRQNGEGGALAAEFKVENVIDRVETTSTVWLGLTMGCARCHDHKYDPLSQKEFFQLYAYFNNIGEKGIGNGINSNPTLKTISPLASENRHLVEQVETHESSVAELQKTAAKRQSKWAATLHSELKLVQTDWRAAAIEKVQLLGDGELKLGDDQTINFFGGTTRDVGYEIEMGDTGESKIAAIKIEALPADRLGAPLKLAPSVNGNFVLTDLALESGGKTIPVAAISATYEQDNYPVKAAVDDDPSTGWAVFGSGNQAEPLHAIVQLKEPIVVKVDSPLRMTLRFGSQFAGHSIGKMRIGFSDSPVSGSAGPDQLPAMVYKALVKDAKTRTKADKQAIQKHFATIDEVLKEARQRLKTAEQEMTKVTGPRANVMVMREKAGKPEPAYLLDRGQYDKPIKEDELERGVPAALLSSNSRSQPKNRLELANWLVSRDNPLTARVIVNRMWQDHFGVGLVKSAGDFGLQGEMPSHPELLDWLAVEFIDSGWDVKAMHRRIVTSAAFGQVSYHSSQLDELDPDNRLIGRGPRYRADGFVIRDLALQASGLLNETVGGPSVKPYQPDGLWQSMAAGAATRYVPDQGDDLYRKSMYTYWKRAVNPPRQTIFDATGREVCNVQVRRTNTPLQALVLMNDPTYVEAARHLAQRSMQSEAKGDREQVAQMYLWAIAKKPNEATINVLLGNLAHFQSYFVSHPEAAAKFLESGQSSRDESLNVPQLAALATVAHLILNTDEFVSVE